MSIFILWMLWVNPTFAIHPKRPGGELGSRGASKSCLAKLSGMFPRKPLVESLDPHQIFVNHGLDPQKISFKLSQEDSAKLSGAHMALQVFYDDRDVGMIEFSWGIANGPADITHVWVEEGFRKKGFGRVLHLTAAVLTLDHWDKSLAESDGEHRAPESLELWDRLEKDKVTASYWGRLARKRRRLFLAVLQQKIIRDFYTPRFTTDSTVPN